MMTVLPCWSRSTIRVPSGPDFQEVDAPPDDVPTSACLLDQVCHDFSTHVCRVDVHEVSRGAAAANDESMVLPACLIYLMSCVCITLKLAVVVCCCGHFPCLISNSSRVLSLGPSPTIEAARSPVVQPRFRFWSGPEESCFFLASGMKLTFC